MDLRRPVILPDPTDRATFLGATKSGKTHGALRLLAYYYERYPLIFLNSSADDQLEALDVPVAKGLSQLGRFPWPKFPAFTYEPSREELASPEALDAFCQWVYERGDSILYIDELTQLNAGKTIPLPGFLNLYARGRRHGVGTWSASQRPVRIPPNVISEAEWVFEFQLRRKMDLIAVRDGTMDGMEEPLPVSKERGHAVRIYHVGEGFRTANTIEEALRWTSFEPE